MNIVLDTTYLLPLIGISVNEIPDDVVLKLLNEGYGLRISKVTIFELIAKGAKYVRLGILSPMRVIRGVKAIVHNDRIEKIELDNADILYTSFKLRKHLEDYIDCIILSTAIHYADIMLTEDSELLALPKKQWFKEIIENINPNLRITSYKALIEQ